MKSQHPQGWACLIIRPLGGWPNISKRVPPSAFARKQFRDGAGEAPSLVDCVSRASIRSFPGITLLRSGADAASVQGGAVVQKYFPWLTSTRRDKVSWV